VTIVARDKGALRAFRAALLYDSLAAELTLVTRASEMTHPSPIRIEPIAGYSPTIGRLVGMLMYARSTMLASVEGLTLAELEHLHDADSNSIGALLAHIAVTERSYQTLTFEERLLSTEENERWSTALKLGKRGRDSLRGYPLEDCLEQLAAVRRDTLDMLAARDDAWLERTSHHHHTSEVT
jgi:hypothetical protein